MFGPRAEDLIEARRTAERLNHESRMKLLRGIQESVNRQMSGEPTLESSSLALLLEVTGPEGQAMARKYIKSKIARYGGYAPIEEKLANRAIQALDEGDLSHPTIANFIKPSELVRKLGR